MVRGGTIVGASSVRRYQHHLDHQLCFFLYNTNIYSSTIKLSKYEIEYQYTYLTQHMS